MHTREYITSERFIWDDLVKKAATSIDVVRKQWGKKQHVPKMVMAWPSSAIVDDQGVPIEGVVHLTLPSDVTLSKAIRDIVQRTNPYALLVFDSSTDGVKVILESHHGTYVWQLEARRHGDVSVLDLVLTTQDTECLGVLWDGKGRSG